MTAATAKRFHMNLVSDDRLLMIDVVNRGIDSYLEAFVDSKFEDKYDENDIKYRVSGPRLFCDIGPRDMPVLLRRLEEAGTDDADSLRSDIIEVSSEEED